MNFKKMLSILGVYVLTGFFIVKPIGTLKEFNTTTVNATEYTYNPNQDQNCIFECDTNDSNSTCVITHYNGTDTNVTIPSKITLYSYNYDYDEYEPKTYTVVGISGFTNSNSNNREKITQITVPNTVKDISKNAFKNYYNLSSVVFEENSCLENIGTGAFLNTKLSEITILSDSLKTIDSNAIGYTNTGTETDLKINCSASNQDVIYDYIKNTDFSMNVTNGTSVSLSLDGNIGVNFYINIGEKILSDTNSTMILSTDNNQTIEIPRNQWILDSSTNMYKFTVYVTAREMSSKITAQLSTSNNTIEYGNCSINEYISLIKNSSNSDTDLVNLSNSIENYGECSTEYFNNGTISEDKKVAIDNEFNNTSLEQYSYVKSGNLKDISYNSSSLVLNSGTNIKHYFNITKNFNPQDYTFLVYKSNDTSKTEIPVEIKYNNGICLVSIENIDASNLDTFYTLEITDKNNNTFTLKYSALSYANIVLKQTDTNISNLDTLKYLMKSLYIYNKCTDTYANE